MNEKDRENIQNQVKEVNDNIKQFQLQHESLNDEYEWNIRRNRLILEQGYLNNKDRTFFVDRLNSLKMMQKEEDDEFEEMENLLKRKVIKYQEEMEGMQRRDNTEENDLPE